MLVGGILMLVLSLVLAWLPLVGPLLAGAIGGYYCGTVSRALVTVLFPALILGIFVWWMGTMLDHAIGGFLFAIGGAVLVIVHEAGLILGAAVGGFIAQRRRPASRPHTA